MSAFAGMTTVAGYRLLRSYHGDYITNPHGNGVASRFPLKTVQADLAIGVPARNIISR